LENGRVALFIRDIDRQRRITYERCYNCFAAVVVAMAGVYAIQSSWTEWTTHAPIVMGRSHIVVLFAERPVTYMVSATLTGLSGVGGLAWSVWTLLITIFRRP